MLRIFMISIRMLEIYEAVGIQKPLSYISAKNLPHFTLDYQTDTKNSLIFDYTECEGPSDCGILLPVKKIGDHSLGSI